MERMFSNTKRTVCLLGVVVHAGEALSIILQDDEFETTLDNIVRLC